MFVDDLNILADTNTQQYPLICPETLLLYGQHPLACVDIGDLLCAYCIRLLYLRLQGSILAVKGAIAMLMWSGGKQILLNHCGEILLIGYLVLCRHCFIFLVIYVIRYLFHLSVMWYCIYTCCTNAIHSNCISYPTITYLTISYPTISL